MKVIVDTNIVFSALLSENNQFRDILFESQYVFYAPNYLFIEIFKYKEKIKKYSKLSEEELYEYLNKILENIRFLSVDWISIENRQNAYDLCKDRDVKDTVFVALTLELQGVLWTGDKKLKNHLLQKEFDKFF